MASHEFKAAIVGVSGYGRIHYSLMREHALAGRLNPVGATIINPDEEAEIVTELTGMGCRIFDDYSDMLDQLRRQVDLCCLPLRFTARAHDLPGPGSRLECPGRKTSGPTIQDVRMIQRAEQATSRFAAVGLPGGLQSTRPGSEAAASGRGFRSDRIDERTRLVAPYPSDYYERNNWAGKLKVGDRWVLDSPLNNALSHYLHLLLFLAGSSQNLTARPLGVAGRTLSRAGHREF